MHSLVRNWWVMLLRGIAALAFGLVVAFYPTAGLMGLLVAFGIYAFVAGCFALGAGIAGGATRRWDLVAEGIIGVLAGIVTFARPGVTALALYALIAAWSLVTGALQVVAAIRLRDEVEGVGWLGFSGVLSVAFGVLMIALPQAGMLALAWMIAAYGILFGVMWIALGLRLRRVGTKIRQEGVRLRPTPGAPQPV
jgi:uncharacterized membrane protein HdeD (DUF308 family)